MSENETQEFEALLEYLKRSRGVDFTGYKRSTLQRRVLKRMQSVAISSYAGYTDFLEVHSDEFPALFDTILINVTSFLRDPEAWDTLAREVLPALMRERTRPEPIRIWTAGCASGEETYTLLMLLAEQLGEDGFRERVKLYATDADEHALNIARQATYAEPDLQLLPPEWVKKYFEQQGGRFTFRHDLRRAIIFGRHDLVQDAPISRLDLLVCRNTLIYFNSETQRRILGRFHFALNDGGAIFLGKAEMLLTHARLFTPIDVRSRIFAKVPASNMRDRLLTLAQSNLDEGSGQDTRALLQLAFESTPVAQIVLDKDGVLIHANAYARSIFRLTSGDFGRLFQDLELSYKPVEIRSRILEAHHSRKPVHLGDIELEQRGAESRYLDVHVFPLYDAAAGASGASVAFVDTTQQHRLQVEVERASNELETAYEELQATNEELETTNEELQSTVEELETTNEELQASNEELETMNEELQSTNEELETTNDELRRTTLEIHKVNLFSESILSSLNGAVVVVDEHMAVRTWNLQAQEMWGLRSEEVLGRPVLKLDIGLPVDQLKDRLRACLDGATDFEEAWLSAVNRRGRPIRCRVACTRMRDGTGQTTGAIMLIDEVAEQRPSAGMHAVSEQERQ